MSGNFPSVVERGLFFIDNPFKQNMYYSVMIGIVSIATMLNMSNVNTYPILSDLHKCLGANGCFWIETLIMAMWNNTKCTIGCGLWLTDKGQASLNLGMDLNLDWMTLEDFQKHLNGEDEILSAPPLSPSKCIPSFSLMFPSSLSTSAVHGPLSSTHAYRQLLMWNLFVPQVSCGMQWKVGITCLWNLHSIPKRTTIWTRRYVLCSILPPALLLSLGSPSCSTYLFSPSTSTN